MEETKEENKPLGLSGTEVKSLINEGIKAERVKWDMEQLQKENGQLKDQVKEAEEYIEKLEKTVKEKPEKSSFGNFNVGELASAALEGFIRRNPDILKKFPGGEALAGALQQQEEESPETHASFKKKATGSELNEEDKQALEVLNMLKNSFGEDELKQVWEILRSLAGKPEEIPTVLALVTK